MTFSFFESSRTKSRPYTLFLIRYGVGANDYYAFTDNESPVVRGGITYTVTQIAHGDIALTGTLDKSVVELTTPRTNPLFEMFKAYPPSYRVRLTIAKGHNGDSGDNSVVVWAGRILGMSVRGSECRFNCEPVSTTMRRLGLRRNWQYGCTHALYQNGCNARKDTVRQNGNVVSVGASSVTLAPGWNGPIAASKFVGGFVEIEGVTTMSRTILRIAANTLILSGSVDGVSPGASIPIYPGCAHDMSDCKGVHDNLVNFGGQPWIPTDNPVGSKNKFY